MREFAFFIVGISTGIAWYKFMIAHLIEKYPHTMCDYCQFLIEKNKMFPKKRK